MDSFLICLNCKKTFFLQHVQIYSFFRIATHACPCFFGSLLQTPMQSLTPARIKILEIGVSPARNLQLLAIEAFSNDVTWLNISIRTLFSFKVLIAEISSGQNFTKNFLQVIITNCGRISWQSKHLKSQPILLF